MFRQDCVPGRPSQQEGRIHRGSWSVLYQPVLQIVFTGDRGPAGEPPHSFVCAQHLLWMDGSYDDDKNVLPAVADICDASPVHWPDYSDVN